MLRRSVGIGVAVMVAGVLAGAPQAVAVSGSSVVAAEDKAPRDLYSQCKGLDSSIGNHNATPSWASTACFFGINDAHVFAGPNQLAPATYQLANPDSQVSQGCPGPATTNDGSAPFAQFPLTFPAQPEVANVAAQFWGCNYWNGGSYTPRIVVGGSWTPPAQLPAGDAVSLGYWTHFASNDEVASSVSCPSTQYTQCDVLQVDEPFSLFTTGANTFPSSTLFRIRNLPFIVEINNNLPAAQHDDLIMSGEAEVSQFILDRKGGYPKTIKAGESGYFGLYAKTQAGSTKQGFSVTYKVAPSSTDIAGTSVSLNVVVDPVTGELDSSSTCQVNVAQQNQAGTCEINLLGGPRAVQTLAVNIYE